MKQKLLFVLTRSPYPAVDGTRERILGELKTLSVDFNISLLIISDENISNSTIEYFKDFIEGEVFLFKLSKIFCYIRSLINIISHSPIQSAYFYNKQALSWLKENSGNFNIINFHTLRLGRYLSYLKKHSLDHKCRLLVSFNDAISLNYKDAAKKANGLWRIIYQIETNRIKEYELKMLTIADGFSIITDRDKKYIENNWREKYQNKEMPEIKVVRNGINDALFNFEYKPKNNNLVFIGNLLYPPNRQGLSFFCKNIWPIILKAIPTTKFLIIGRGGIEFFNNLPNIEILGFVDNPYSLMTEQGLFISPADFGAGVPTKSLLAMAIGLPVVSTITNAAGIEGAIDKDNICLIDYNKYAEAAEKIIDILQDENYRKKIGLAGKKLILEKYSQSANYPILKSFIMS